MHVCVGWVGKWCVCVCVCMVQRLNVRLSPTLPHPPTYPPTLPPTPTHPQVTITSPSQLPSALLSQIDVSEIPLEYASKFPNEVAPRSVLDNLLPLGLSAFSVCVYVCAGVCARARVCVPRG